MKDLNAMSASNLDRDQLVAVIREILVEEPSILIDAIKSAKNQVEARRNRIDAIIEEDFAEYDEVFKALA
ncbi:MAG: hypothetical protein AAGF89_01275 [Bacteroidota bacterium]